MSQLLQNAVYGGAMILAVAALRGALKDRLIPEARLALWAVCLFRLLTPAAPESVLSLWRLLGWEARSAPAPGPAAVPPSVEGTFAPGVTAPAAPAPGPEPAGIPWEMILAGIWLAVGAALAARYALAWVRTRRAVGCAVPIGRDDPRYGPLPGCARLREGVMDGAPLTFGVARPTVVLSPGLSGEELICVLAHESVHARRRDNLWHYVTALALAVYWWNPAVWLMARLLRQDVELSCDRAAVKKLGAERRAEYAKALVSMATAAEGPAFCQTFGRKAAEERIISIMKYKKMTVIGAALTLALVLAVTVGFASNPAEQKADDTVEYHGRTYNRADLSQETLDWLDWYLSLSEEGQMSVSMVPPELIVATDVEDIDAYKDAIDAMIQELIDSLNTYAGGRVEPADPARKVGIDEYKALLDQLVADGKVSQKDADGLFSGAKQALERAEKDGWAAVIQTNSSGSYAIMSASVCTLTDCGNTGVHTHNGVTYNGWANKSTIPPTCTNEEACEGFAPHWHENGDVSNEPHFFYPYDPYGKPIGEPELDYDPRVEDSIGAGGEPIACPPAAIDKTFPFGPHTCADCGVEGCTADYLHQHSGDHTFLMGPVCPREDCDLRGSHDHDGVMYSCNGNCHEGGVCDGSCYAYNDLPVYVDPPVQTTDSSQSQGTGSSSGHHSESHSSGHHGNGHH